MKAYIADFNNIMVKLKERVEVTCDVRQADVLILWQDVRGSMRELCLINKDFMGKPVVVVQHGRGATRDYLAPNHFPLLANRICVWGEAEAERMEKAGYKDRTVITGSPLTFYTRSTNLEPHPERIVTFVPVITTHEEPENLQAYYALKKIEFSYAQDKLARNRDKLKKAWGAWILNEEISTEREIPYDILRSDFFLVSKLTKIHDSKLYHGVAVTTDVANIAHLEETMKLLKVTDVLVGMEEGSLQLMATALGIPTIVIDGFRYGDYGGVANYRTEEIRSHATTFCALSDLRSVIEHELTYKEGKDPARREVVRREFDPYPDKDPIELIIDVASELAGGDIRKEVKNGVTVHCG